MQNLKISYFYRDGSNYKTPGYDHVLKGSLSPIERREIEMTCQDEEYFIPEQVGLPDSYAQFAEQGYGYEEQDDHVFNELTDLELVNEEPTLEMTAQELLARFREVRANGGWDLLAATTSKGW